MGNHTPPTNAQHIQAPTYNELFDLAQSLKSRLELLEKNVIGNFLKDLMDEFKDLYITYLNNNEDEDNQMSELEFFKVAFKGAMGKMDELRQQYHNLQQEFKTKKNESLYYSEELIKIEGEKKTLADEIMSLKVNEKALTEKCTILKTKNGILEEEVTILKTKYGNLEEKDEPQFLRSPTFSNKAKEDLQSIQTRVTFLENLVCSKMTNLNLSNQDKSIEEDVDVKKAEDSILVEEKICTEWWCPKHSNFKEILDKIIMKDQSTKDKYLIRKAKARYVYWQGEKDKNMPRCPVQDRLKGEIGIFLAPTCWPSNH